MGTITSLGNLWTKGEIKQKVHTAGISNILTYQYQNPSLADTVGEELGSIEVASDISGLDAENRDLTAIVNESVNVIKGNKTLSTTENHLFNVTESVATRYLVGVRKAMCEAVKATGNYHEHFAVDTIWHHPLTKEKIQSAGLNKMLGYNYKNPLFADTIGEELGTVETAKKISEIDLEGQDLKTIVSSAVEVIKGNENLKTAENHLFNIPDAVSQRYLEGVRAAMQEISTSSGCHNFNTPDLTDVFNPKKEG